MPRLPLSLRVFLSGLFILGLGAGWTLWHRQREQIPVRILLVTPKPEAGSGLNHYETRAITALFQDQLETGRWTAVTPTTERPTNLQKMARPEPWWVLTVEPNKKGDDLGFRLSLVRVNPAHTDPETIFEIPPGPPSEALTRLCLSLPSPLRPSLNLRLLPATPSGFWTCIQANSLRFNNTRIPEAIALSREFLAKEPDSATAYLTLASLLYRKLLDEPSPDAVHLLEEAESCLAKALLLAPDHPRIALQWAQFKVDSGDQREAFRALFSSLDEHPLNPFLLTGVAFTARITGLLNLSKKALDRRDLMTFPEHQPLSIDLLWIYLGDLTRFERTLQEQPGHLRVSIQRFYRGYSYLLQGRRAEALEAFARVEEVPGGFPQYIRLAAVFRLALEGRQEEGRQALRSLEKDRSSLRVPDGEFTIRMAEAHALLEDPEGAVDMGTRAFAQGFGAVVWYERSPLLQSIQGWPRWQALLRNVKERQKFLESMPVPAQLR